MRQKVAMPSISVILVVSFILWIALRKRKKSLGPCGKCNNIGCKEHKK